MSNSAKNLLIGCFIMGTATSCSTLKRSTGAKAPERAPASSSRSATSPRFIENIAINSRDFSQGKSSGDGYYTPPKVEGAGNVELVSPLAFKYAILLDAPVETITDVKMFEFIESWFGTRYRYGGNDRSGIDCSAFVQTFISANYNVQLPRTSASQYEFSKRIGKDDLQEGDLVFFKTMGRRRGVSHVGVYLRNNKFVHASTSLGVTINDMNDTYYYQHYAGAGRVR